MGHPFSNLLRWIKTKLWHFYSLTIDKIIFSYVFWFEWLAFTLDLVKFLNLFLKSKV